MSDKKEFHVPVLLTIKAETYNEALNHAEEFVNHWHRDEHINDEDLNRIKAEVVVNFEHDNDGQRCVYLHPEQADATWEVP